MISGKQQVQIFLIFHQAQCVIILIIWLASSLYSIAGECKLEAPFPNWGGFFQVRDKQKSGHNSCQQIHCKVQGGKAENGRYVAGQNKVSVDFAEKLYCS